MAVKDDRICIKLRPWQCVVLSQQGAEVSGRTVAIVQVNNAPTCPSDKLAIIGDCPELGEWNLEKAYHLECVNANTWFAEVPFEESAGKPAAYKFVIFRADAGMPPEREPRTVRRRQVLPEGSVKWRDRWGE